MVPITGEVGVVNPNVLSVLNTNCITRVSEDLGNLNISDDDIANINDTEANSAKSCVKHICEYYLLYQTLLLTRATLTQNGGVGTYFDDSISSDRAYTADT